MNKNYAQNLKDTEFHIQRSGKYPQPEDTAIHFLMSCATIYVCVGEIMFSVLVALLSKYKIRINAESGLRLDDKY